MMHTEPVKFKQLVQERLVFGEPVRCGAVHSIATLLTIDIVPLQLQMKLSYMYMLACYSLCRQIAAINKLSQAGLHFWDYGNAFLLEASRAGDWTL